MVRPLTHDLPSGLPHAFDAINDPAQNASGQTASAQIACHVCRPHIAVTAGLAKRFVPKEQTWGIEQPLLGRTPQSVVRPRGVTH